MSNVAKHNNQHKFNNQNNISRVQHQSINPRGSAPVDNHSRPDHRLTYSSVARQALPQSHQTHESVLGKGHPSANTIQQVVLPPQPTLGSQVQNVNPAGAQMSNPAVPNSATILQQNVAQVMPQSGPRFNQPFHHNQRPQQRPTLLTNHRTQSAVPTSTGLQQTVPQQVSHHNIAQHNTPQHQHYYFMSNPQHIQQLQNQQIINQQMSHPYAQQTRNIPQVPQYFIPYGIGQQQQTFAASQYSPYMYPQAQYQAHAQPTAHMMSSQMHQQRGSQVTAPAVIQAPQQMAVQMSTPNIELNETTQQPIAQKPIQKRQKQLAVITDPNSGQNLNIEELAKEDVSKKQTPIARTNESNTGASNRPNASSASSPKPDVDIALQFATKVAVAASEPGPGQTSAGINTVNDMTFVNSNSKLENEESVAIVEQTSSELSETNDKISDKCEPLAQNSIENDINSTNVTNTTISASIHNFDTENNIKQLNSSASAQNCIEINSQLSADKGLPQDLSQNGNITDSSNQSMEDKDQVIEDIEIRPEIAKDYSIQKVNNNNNNNNNNRKKESIIKKGDINRKLEELDDNHSDVTDNAVTVIDKIEPQPTDPKSDPTPVPVMLSSLPIESVENSVEIEINCNNINENDLKIENQEKDGINENEDKNSSLDSNQIESETDIPSPKTTLPDLPYKSDQWTPLNPEGKKAYDRDFLIAVRQKSENSLKMPESLMSGDIRNHEILRKESGGSGHVGDDPFLPGYASKSGDMRNRFMPQVGRRQSQPGKHSDKQRKIISTSLTQDVKLHSAENAWKPTKTVSTVSDPEELKTLELLKKIRGILNKLTPQKYDSLVGQILSFKIDTEDRLKRVLDLVFEKAVDEPAFCIQYANLCKHLSSFKVMVSKDDNNVEEVKFHKLLLSKCQKEFETDIYASITDLKERQQEIDKCSDPQKKKLMWEVLDEDMRKARKRSLGNIKLIGELYKLNMLRAMIMVQCIENLVKDSDDESLECLCALFKTIGDQIETEVQKSGKQNIILTLDDFFRKMENISEQRDPSIKNTSARVRFMLRDVIDMRKNGWKARRDENLPKMIDEIHSEAQKEVEQSARDLHQHTLNRKQEDRDRNKKGGRQTNDGVDPPGWTTVSGRKSQTAPQQQPNIDWQKMRNMQQQNHDNVQLGPQSSSSWSMGSRGGAQTSQSRYPSMGDDKQANRFSALDANESRKSSQRSNIPSRDSSKGRSGQQHSYQQSGRGGRSQGGGARGGEREDAINLARNFSSRQSPSESSPMYSNMISRNSSRSGSREASAPNSRNSSMRRETPDCDVSPPLKGQNISEEELEKRSMTSVKEYLNVKNLNEPVLDVTNICNDSNAHIYLTTAINYALDSSSQTDHFSIGKLINHLVSTKTIKIEHLYKGLSSIMSCAGDVELDVPKMWDYIGEVLAPIFVDLNSSRKTFLLEIAKLCDHNNSSKLVAKTMRAVLNLTNEIKANELWISSDLNWKDFLRSDEEVNEFVAKYNVEFTTKSPNKSLNFDQNLQTFGKEVEKLVEQKTSNDEIQNYISKYFNASQTSDDRFTSALFRAVIKGCIIAAPDARESHSYTLDVPKLTSIAPLLSKFLGGDPERELQALIVLQQMMDELEHPPKLLSTIFDNLYEFSVISHDAFLQWEKSDNSPGKAVAVKSVVRFMTWLRENDDDEDESEVAVS